MENDALRTLDSKLTNNIITTGGELEMSIKTTLANPPTIALHNIGAVLILASMVGFRTGGMLWPMLGSAAGRKSLQIINRVSLLLAMKF